MFPKHAHLFTLLPSGKSLCLSLNAAHNFLLPDPPAHCLQVNKSGSKKTLAKCTPSSAGLPNQRACFSSCGGKNEHFTEQLESAMTRLGEPAPNTCRIGLNLLSIALSHGPNCPTSFVSRGKDQEFSYTSIRAGRASPCTGPGREPLPSGPYIPPLHPLLEPSTACPSQKVQNACKLL